MSYCDNYFLQPLGCCNLNVVHNLYSEHIPNSHNYPKLVTVHNCIEYFSKMISLFWKRWNNVRILTIVEYKLKIRQGLEHPECLFFPIYFDMYRL